MRKKFIFLHAFSNSTGIKRALIVMSVFFLIMTNAQTTTLTFSYTGSTQNFTVPSGVTSVNVKIWGAGGAGSDGSGGSGAFLKGTLAVTAGQTLTFVVGGGGSYSNTTVSAGGYGGGGASGGAYGGSGGGYSGIFSSATLSQANVLALAGGGGGGGYYGDSTYGGAGGATTGSNGGNAASASYTSGRGATTSAGGAGGQYNTAGNNRNGYTGSALQGAAGNSFNTNYSYYGGGGGGGYFGGGSGYSSNDATNYSSAGGGGSSYSSASLTSVTNTAGTISSTSAVTQAPGSAETGYIAGVGNGSQGDFTLSSAKGGDGLIVISYTTPACVTPSAQPTALTFGTTTSTSIAGSFTAPTSVPSGYLILRSTSSTVPTPVNGTTYTTGNTVTLDSNSYYVIQGSAVTANARTFTDSGLTSNTRYYYYVYSYNNGCTGAPAYRTASPLTSNKITCAAAPTALSVGTITSSGATFTWSSAAGGGAGAVTSTLNIYSNSGYTTLVTTVPNVTSSHVLSSGLAANTTYYYQIVNSNAGGCSSSTNGGSFTTLCATVGVPYTEDFNSVTVPAIPSCTTVINAGAGNAWATAANPANYGFSSQVLRYSFSTANAANTWFFTKGLNLTSGVSYRLTFKYNNNSATYTEKMKVAYGTANTVAAMTNTLADYPSIIGGGTTANSVTIDFVPSSTGVFYIGFQAYSAADQFYLYLDDISVNVTPDPITITPASASLCLGDSTTLTASSATAYTYSWSPSAGLSSTSGATVTANPTATTTYTVTGTSGSVTNTKTVTVIVNPVPPAISITDIVSPVSATACNTDYVTLDIGTPSPVALAKEGFENASYIFSLFANPLLNTNFFINSALATEGTKSSRMNYSGSATGFSQMLLTNPINLSNAQSAILTFDHIAALEGDGYDYGNPIYSTDGVTYYLMPVSFYSGLGSTDATTVRFDKNSYSTWNAMTASTTPTNTMWKSETINLSSLIGNSQVYIGFQMVHDASGNFHGWSIDNVKVNATPKTTWSPATGLYTNSALTTPYVANANATTLYAAPAGTQAYTAKSSLGSCEKIATKSVTRDKYEFRGTISNDWNNSGNWFPASVPDNSKCVDVPATANVIVNTTTAEVKSLTIASTGKITISANNSLKVIDGINITNNADNDNLVIESDGVLLQENGNAVNTGKILARRNVKMRKTDYTYWSSPVTGQKLINDATLNDGFSVGTPNNRIYQYNEPNDKFVAVSAAETTFINAKGYAIRGKDAYNVTTPTADTNLKFVGTPNNGSYSIDIQKSPDTGTGTTGVHGYNMIGNPYPSNIDFVKFFNLGNNKNIIHGKAWFWTNVSPSVTQQGSTYLGNNYATLTLAGGTPPTYSDTTVTPSPTSGAYTPTKNIKVSQGFIVQAKTIGTGQTLTFDNTIRNSDTGVFYNNNKMSDEVNRYWLKMISPQNIINTILIAHMDGASNNFDGDYDADILVVGDDSFYSKVDAHKLQIQSRASFTDADVVPVGNKYSANGIYKISLENREGIFANNQNVYLKDKLLNTITDLKAGDYSFTATKGLDETRFEIVYKDNGVLAVDSAIKSEFDVYRSNGNFTVKSSKPLGKIEVYDASGRLMMSAKTRETNFTIDASVLINGIYIIKAENSGDVRTKKIIK